MCPDTHSDSILRTHSFSSPCLPGDQRQQANYQCSAPDCSSQYWLSGLDNVHSAQVNRGLVTVGCGIAEDKGELIKCGLEEK